MSANAISPPQSRCRILVADDVDFNRDFIGAVLAAADFDVDLVCDGFAVCEAAAKSAYDLILMDIEMPGMDGFEAAMRIRAGDDLVPIAALTSTCRPQARELSERSGMDLFIARPIEAKSLVRQVSRILADRARCGNTTRKLTWRFSIFSDLSTQIGREKMDRNLTYLTAYLDSMTSFITSGLTATDGFYAHVHDLLSVSGLLGFEHLSALCFEIQADRNDIDRRDRSHDLLRAIEGAAEAIDAYQGNKLLTPKPH